MPTPAPPVRYYRCNKCTFTPGPIPPTYIQLSSPGPMQPRVMFVGDAPGPIDARGGEHWLGEAGRELEELYLPAAGLRRSQVHLTNVLKCPCADSTRPPEPAELWSCAERNLWREIVAVQPDVIIPMGGLAAQVFRVRLNSTHGIPQLSTITSGGLGQPPGEWSGFILPTYHPNAGMGRDKAAQFIGAICYDMEALREFLRTLSVREDPQPTTNYREITTPAEWWDYIGREPTAGMYDIDSGMDTESDTTNGNRSAPIWSVQICVRPGDAVFIRAGNTELLAVVNAWYNRPRGSRPRAVYHSALHDFTAQESIGLYTPRFSDTMAYAYILGLPSKGLKYLTRRYLGMPIRDFWSVVGAYSRAYIAKYFQTFVTAYEDEYRYIHTLTSGKRKGTQEYRWERFMLTAVAGSKSLADATDGHVYASQGEANKTLKTLGGSACGLTIARVQPPNKRTYTKVRGLLKALGALAVPTTSIVEAEDPADIEDVNSEAVPPVDTATAADTQADEDEDTDAQAEDLDDSYTGVDPWKRWDGWNPADRAYIQDTVKSMTFSYPSITHVPESEAIDYACGDADATLRLYYLLRRMAKAYGKPHPERYLLPE